MCHLFGRLRRGREITSLTMRAWYVIFFFTLTCELLGTYFSLKTKDIWLNNFVVDVQFQLIIQSVLTRGWQKIEEFVLSARGEFLRPMSKSWPMRAIRMLMIQRLLFATVIKVHGSINISPIFAQFIGISNNTRNISLGTQGGTFTHQRENPFNRARRSQTRQDANNSSDNSSDSEQSFVTTEDGVSTSAGEPSNVNVFMVSDNHSINSKILHHTHTHSKENVYNIYIYIFVVFSYSRTARFRKLGGQQRKVTCGKFIPKHSRDSNTSSHTSVATCSVEFRDIKFWFLCGYLG